MAAQLYKTDSGRLFHAGAIAIVTVGYVMGGFTQWAKRNATSDPIEAARSNDPHAMFIAIGFLHEARHMYQDHYVDICGGWG